MAYSPSINDIPSDILQQHTDNNISGANNAYVPSLEDAQAALMPTSTMQSQAQPQSPETLLNNPLTNYYKGVAHSVGSMGTDIANLLPGVNMQMPQLGSGTAYNLGNIAGNLGMFAAGGEGLDALRAIPAAADIPGISKAAQWLGGEIPGISAKFGGSQFLPAIARQSIGGGIYGGITNPDDRTQGTLEGAAISAPFAAAPAAFSGIKTLSDYFNPNKVASQILSKIGGGQNVADNAKSLASDIQNSYNQQAAPLKQGFDDIRSQVGDQSIYGNSSNVLDSSNTVGNRSLGTQLDTNYSSVYPNIEKYLTPDLSDLHATFTANPTYNNARQLFSQYASEVARLQGKGAPNLDSSENAQLQSLLKGKSAIDSDIQSFLTSQNSSLTDQYNQLKKSWVQNVIPYHASDVSQLLGQNPDVPVNIHTLFGTSRHLPDANDLKVFSDLPENSQNKIIYSALGKQATTKTPEALNSNINKLGEQGLGDFVSPALQDQFSQLQDTLNRRSELNTTTGGGLGYLLGHHLGFSPETTGLIGGYMGNKILPKIYNLPLVQSLAKGVAAGTQAAYSPTSTALRANLIPGAQ